jgi:eukaryotic-like serine/threonine-protein kinase
VASEPELVGQTLAGRFDLLAVLGSGGMGDVYRAHDRELVEQVALKVINREHLTHETALTQFREEVKLARRVTHRNVARTFELGHDEGRTFYTMELVEGESLTYRIARGKLPIGDAVAIASELCDGLAAAHAVGVVHRDIKPGNILLGVDGRVVLVDFGVAKIRATELPDISGTPGYMAPEQARGEPANPASDLYAVGVVLYEMLTGQRAFTGNHLSIVLAQQDLPALEIQDGVTPPALAAVVARATSRDAIDRVASAGELKRMLAPWAPDDVSLDARPSAKSPCLAVRTVVVVPPRA